MICLSSESNEVKLSIIPTLNFIAIGIIVLAVNAHAEDAEHRLQHAKPRSAIVASEAIPGSFGLRGVAPVDVEEAQAADLHHPEHISGLVLDYYPFDGEFRVSAGRFQEDHKAPGLRQHTGSNLGYFGVGWNRIVDDSERLGVSLELGAYFREQGGQQGNESGALAVSSEEEFSKKDKPWRPAINLEVNYRF